MGAKKGKKPFDKDRKKLQKAYNAEHALAMNKGKNVEDSSVSYEDAFKNLGQAITKLQKLYSYDTKQKEYTALEWDQIQYLKQQITRDEFQKKHGVDPEAKYQDARAFGV